METGSGMAQAGVILGIVAIVLFVFGIIAFAGGLVSVPTTSP
jgi:hypothetical protein